MTIVRIRHLMRCVDQEHITIRWWSALNIGYQIRVTGRRWCDASVCGLIRWRTAGTVRFD